MISLSNRLFHKRDQDADSAWRQIIGLLLEGIAQHAAEGNRADYERFRAELNDLVRRVTPEAPVTELSVIAAGAIRAMEDHNVRTSRLLREQRMELQEMAAMLRQAAAASRDENSATRLSEIEKALEDKAQQTREWMGAHEFPPELDPATSLPNKKEADRALQAAISSPEGKFLLIGVIGRVQAVNARFGYDAGDRMLEASAKHFLRNLSPDLLFRWHGPAILAILETAERIDLVRARLRHFADAKLEVRVDVGSRVVLIPVSTNWSLIPVTGPVEALLKKIDAFTAAQISRDYA